MATGITYITTKGSILAAKTLEAKKLQFSKFVIGDGQLADTSANAIKSLTALASSVLNFDITKISRETETQVTVRGLFQNTDANHSFYLRELGLYAIDPDTNEEILFAYINYGDEAEYINNSISAKKEHYFDMVITVDNADNVTITTDPTTVYVTEKDFNALKEITVAPNAGAHNAIYRGKNITDLFYDGTLTKQIAAGTFDDIFVGDYIIGKSSGRKYLVADINYRLHCGDTECTTPHILMIPEKIMGTAQMNASNDTTGGYTGSAMYTANLAAYKTVIQNDFGAGHILNHRALLTNATSNGASSGWAWFDSTIELMNECMVYGHNAWGAKPGYETGADKSQLSLFRHKPDLIVAKNDGGSRYWYWLRDVASAANFATVNGSGNAGNSNASYSYGVRPAFLIY